MQTPAPRVALIDVLLQPNLRPLRQAPFKDQPHLISATSNSKHINKPRGLTKGRPGRPRKNPLVNTNPPSAINDPTLHDGFFEWPDDKKYLAVNPLIALQSHTVPVHSEESRPFNSITNPLDDSFSVARAIGDIAYSYRHKLVFERMSELGGQPLSTTPDQQQQRQYNVPSPCSASNNAVLLPHVKPLSSQEREAIYQSLSSSLGPACGMQECVGTYKKHMQDRSRLYYECLLSISCHSARHLDKPKKTVDLAQTAALNTNEFRRWMAPAEILGCERTDIRSSGLKRDGKRTRPKQREEGCNAEPCLIGFDRLSEQTLDDLFQRIAIDPPMDRSYGTESPVIHSQPAPPIILDLYAQSGDEDEEHGDGEHDSSFPDSPKTDVLLSYVQPLTTIPARHLSQVHGITDVASCLWTAKISTADMEQSRQGEPPGPRYPPNLCVDSTASPGPSDCGPRLGTRKIHTRARFAACSPYQSPLRKRGDVKTRSIMSRGSRTRTTSAGGGI